MFALIVFAFVVWIFSQHGKFQQYYDLTKGATTHVNTTPGASVPFSARPQKPSGSPVNPMPASVSPQ